MVAFDPCSVEVNNQSLPSASSRTLVLAFGRNAAAEPVSSASKNDISLDAVSLLKWEVAKTHEVLCRIEEQNRRGKKKIRVEVAEELLKIFHTETAVMVDSLSWWSGMIRCLGIPSLRNVLAILANWRCSVKHFRLLGFLGNTGFFPTLTIILNTIFSSWSRL